MQRYKLLFRLTNVIGIKNLKLRNVAWVLLLLHINGNTFVDILRHFRFVMPLFTCFFCNIFHFYCLIHIYKKNNL